MADETLLPTADSSAADAAPASPVAPPMPGAPLPGATLPGATLPGATLPGATLPGATLPGATVPSQSIDMLERERAQLIAAFNARWAELNEQADFFVRRAHDLDTAQVVREATATCPRNRLYKHFTYRFQWSDSHRQETRRTPHTEFCGSGKCRVHAMAEEQLFRERLENWERWSQLDSRLSALRHDRFALVDRLADLDSQIASLRTLLGQPRPEGASPMLLAHADTPLLERPEPLAPASHASPQEQHELKTRIVEAVRNDRYPEELLVRDHDGRLWVRGDELIPFVTHAQLLAEEHQVDPDVCMELLKRHPDEIDHVAPQALEEPRLFLWMLRDAKPLVPRAMPRTSERIRNDARLMIKAMEVDWSLVKAFAGEELRNDIDVALDALKRFDEDVRETVAWLGPKARDSAEVMSLACQLEPHSIVHASQRLKGDRDFVVKLLTEAAELSDRAAAAAKRPSGPPSQDWQLIKRLQQEGRQDPLRASAPQLDSWRGVQEFLETVPDALKDDEEVMRLAVLQDGRAARYVSERLRGDRRFVINTIEDSMQRHGKARAGTTAVWLSRNLPDTLRDDAEVARSAIEASAGQAIMDCWSHRLRTDKSFVMEVLKRAVFRRKMLSQVDESLRDDEDVVCTALEGEGAAILEASERLRNKSTFLRRAIDVSSDPATMNRVAELLLQLHGGPESTPEDVKGYRWDAATRLLVDLNFLPDIMADDDDVVVAALETGVSLEGASDRLKSDVEFALRAIERFAKRATLDLFQLKFGERVVGEFSDRLKDNDRVMLAAIKRSGATAKYASARLRKDVRFAIAALRASQDPKETLSHLDPALRDNDQVMLAAARTAPQAAVQLASSRLRNNVQFAEAALSAAPDPSELTSRLAGALAKKHKDERPNERPSDSRPATAKSAEKRTKSPAPARRANASGESEPFVIRPLDVVIVAVVVAVVLMVGALFYIDPRVGGGLAILLTIAGVVYLVIASLSGAVGTDEPETPKDAAVRTRQHKADNVRYDRSGKIESEDRREGRKYLD